MVSLAGVSKRYGSQVVLEEVSLERPRRRPRRTHRPERCRQVDFAAASWRASWSPTAAPSPCRAARASAICRSTSWGSGGESVLDHALAAFADLHALEERRADLEHQLATVDPQRDEYAAIMDRYIAVCEEWDHRGRYDIESETETVLHGLGFTDADLDRDLAALSGGWQMRAALAQLLLRRPDVLLLDEPTNYLDLEARNWLEEFLAAYPGTLIMVAHDRYFLDVAVDHIAEVLHGKVTDYPMNYSRYLDERETRLEQARIGLRERRRRRSSASRRSSPDSATRPRRRRWSRAA